MRLLTRNKQRAARAGNWYMRPYLQTLVDTAKTIESLRGIGDAGALALVYQLLVAAQYFAVSQRTLTMMFGDRLLQKTRACYERELRLLIRARLMLR